MSTGTRDVILEARDVSRSFRGLQALADYNLRLHSGEILGVIGPNGAGKTTLFNAVTGVLPPTAGRIEFDGRDITRLPPHKRARRLTCPSCAQCRPRTTMPMLA